MCNFRMITNECFYVSGLHGLAFQEVATYFMPWSFVVERMISWGWMPLPHCFSVRIFWWYRLRHQSKFSLEEGNN